MSQTHVTNNEVISRNHRNLLSKKLTKRCQGNKKTVRRGQVVAKGCFEKIYENRSELAVGEDDASFPFFL